MRTRNVVIGLAIGATSLLALGGYAAAQRHGFRPHGEHAMMGKFVDFMVNEKLDELKASDVQKQRVLEIKQRLMSEGRTLHEGRGEFHERLLSLLAQDTPDTAELHALVNAHKEKLSALADKALDAALELHDVLTPEQRQQLAADLREHMERHRP